MSATLESAKVFTAAAAAAKTTTYKDKLYKYAWDKAQQYVDQQELPASWDRTQLLGSMDLGDSDEVCTLTAVKAQIPLYRLPHDVRDKSAINPATSVLAQIPLRRLSRREVSGKSA